VCASLCVRVCVCVSRYLYEPVARARIHCRPTSATVYVAVYVVVCCNAFAMYCTATQRVASATVLVCEHASRAMI